MASETSQTNMHHAQIHVKSSIDYRNFGAMPDPMKFCKCKRPHSQAKCITYVDTMQKE